MNAKEAKQVSEDSSKIMEDITKAAFEGKRKIIVYSLSTLMKSGLSSLGYKITSFEGGPNETNYEISW